MRLTWKMDFIERVIVMFKRFSRYLQLDFSSNTEKIRSRLDVSSKEANELDECIRTYIAHFRSEEENVKEAIKKLIPMSSKENGVGRLDSDAVVLARHYGRRDGKWTWQEDLFCVLAYLFTFFSLLIDIADVTKIFGTAVISICQFGAIILVAMLWLLINISFLGNRKIKVWFSLGNRFMPGLTIVVYLLYYVIKMAYVNYLSAIWIYIMIGIVAMYALWGIWETIRRRRVYIFVKNRIEGKSGI